MSQHLTKALGGRYPAAKGLKQPDESIRHMVRPLRITFHGAFYPVTARGNEQKAVFKSIRDS